MDSEEQLGETRYDNQSNASIPKKIYLFDDGTIGATWTRSMEETSFFADRGTGYNYYDGNSWAPWPVSRVEDIKVHRPTYAPWGENGEIIISHTSGSGLYMATCEEKGSGDWDFESISGPPGEDYLVWNRMVTSGTDHNRIHLLSLTLPSTHGGTPYEGLDGALLYSLSTNGGLTWQIEHEILDGMTSDDYTGFGGDTYAFAEPRGDVVAFVVGDPWTGLFLMKSTDGGENFEKTVIWEHPYPDWEFGTVTDTFYCSDGSHSLVIGSDDIVHVAFGINRAQADESATYWYPWVDGIAYWNENMPSFSNDLHALDPNNHPDSELIEDYNLIGWTQDVNNNGTLEFLDELGSYWIGLSSMPQLSLDDSDILYLVFSSVTETFDNGNANYRHLWARGSANGQYWSDSFIHLTSDLIHIFDECVFPAVAANSDDHLYMIYQYDSDPGTAVWGGQHDYNDNAISFISHYKTYISPGVIENSSGLSYQTVSQNHPNPFNTTSKILVETINSCDLILEVHSIEGRKVYQDQLLNTRPGNHNFVINGEQLSPGIYFYTVSDGTSSVTRKMIVE